jgi:hypothetical protein
MCPFCRGSTIDGVVIHLLGRSTMLQWKPRLVAVAAVLMLVILALGTAVFGELAGCNLYW